MKRRERKQITPDQERRRANRRQRIIRAAGRVLFLAILVAAAICALTIFFKVKTISVEGAMRYHAEEIVAGMGVKQGDNLYLWNKVKVSDRLLHDFPYLESVQIRRRLPDTLMVTVTECSGAVAVPSGTGYCYLSEQGKVLELSETDGGLATVSGVALEDAEPGELVERAQDAYVDALLDVLQTLDAAGMLDGLRFINLTDLTDIRIGYEGRFDIRVGTLDGLSYRIRFAQTVIGERLSPSDIGRLYWDDQNRLHFVPDTAENVAASANETETGSSPPVNLESLEDEPDDPDDPEHADDPDGEDEPGDEHDPDDSDSTDGDGEDADSEETYDGEDGSETDEASSEDGALSDEYDEYDADSADDGLEE